MKKYIKCQFEEICAEYNCGCCETCVNNKVRNRRVSYFKKANDAEKTDPDAITTFHYNDTLAIHYLICPKCRGSFASNVNNPDTFVECENCGYPIKIN